MLLGPPSNGIWCLFIIALHATSVYPSENFGDAHRDEATGFRALLTDSDVHLSEAEAAKLLKGYGIDRYQRIVYRSRIPACHVQDTPASTIGQIVNLCQQLTTVRNCAVAADRRGDVVGSDVMPLFQFQCENGTCMDTWVPSSSSCDFETFFGVPLVRTSEGPCQLDDETKHVSSFEPGLLLPLGASLQELACLYGLPNGTRAFSEEHCDNEKRHVDVLFRLADQAFVEDGIGFWCTWDARCRGMDGCCKGNSPYEGEFICFVDANVSSRGGTSESILGALPRPALTAGLLVVLYFFG